MNIRALILSPLGPALVLAIGGLLLALVRRLTLQPLFPHSAPDSALDSVNGRGFRLTSLLGAPLALPIVFATLASLFLLRLRPVEASFIRTWQPLTVAGGVLEWRVDGWNWLAAVLVTLVTAVALVLGDIEKDPTQGQGWRAGNSERTLWLAAAALLFVFSQNVVTLVSSWMLLDGALLFRLHPGDSAEPAGRSWGLLSFTALALLGVLALLGEPGLRLSLPNGPFDRMVLGLLWVVALVRAGVYPLHLWLNAHDRLDAGESVTLHLIVPMTGLWLMGRLYQAAGPQWLHRVEWAALASLALLGTALVAWATDREARRWQWIALNRASLAAMLAYTSALVGPQMLVWTLITFGLGGALLAIGHLTRALWGWRLPALLAALLVWGLPGTPGFFARQVLVYPTGLAVAIPLFGIVLLAETLLVAALWQFVAGPPDEGDQNAKDSDSSPARITSPRPLAAAEVILATGMVVMPAIAWGILPQFLTRLLGMPESEGFAGLFEALTHARRSVWLGLILSGAAGIALGLTRRQIFAQMRGWQSGIVSVVSLEWLYRAVSGGMALLGGGLRYFASLGEGEGYLGWLMLAGLILWLMLR